MSQISLKSISGITSITTPAGVDNVFTVHTNDTTEKFRVDQTGNQNISGIVTASNFKTGVSNLHSVGLTLSGGQLDVGNNIKAGNAGVVTASGADIDDFISVGSNIHLGNAGVVTATSFVGSGAQLTGIVGGKFNGPAAGILTTSSVGIQTADVTSANLVGAASSLVGLYIGDGSLLFSNNLSRSGGYYITTGVNALNAGPVTLNSALTLDGTWVIV